MAKLTEHVIRRVLQDESRTRLDLQLARAKAYLEARERGENNNAAYAGIVPEMAELQRAYDAANIEGQIIRWLMRQSLDDDRVPSADFNE